MNKAFEKILDKLEELRETYDEMAFIEMNTNGHTLDFEYAKGKKDVMLDVKEIVREVAEEYKGGWIPCSERLPKENQQVILQDFYGNITIEKMKINDGAKGFSDGDWWSSANNYVAWQPLPEPYKERD